MNSHIKNKTLRKIADTLTKRMVPFTYNAPDWTGVSPHICATGVSGKDVTLFSHGSEVYMHGTVPYECALMAIVGPEESLAEMYPMRKERVDCARLGMSFQTDGENALMGVKELKAIDKRFAELGNKVWNQASNIRRLLQKQVKQTKEIERMEENALRMAVLWCGYAEGE